MNRYAYTLMELLLTVVILGIAAAVVVPSLMEPGQMNVQAAARQIIADILIAQNEAVAEAQPRRIEFDVDNNSYRLTDSAGATLGLPWAKGGYTVSFDDDPRFNNVRITAADFGGNPWVGFDEIGGPDSGGTVDIQANDHRYRITVRAFTGRVTVEPVE